MKKRGRGTRALKKVLRDQEREKNVGYLGIDLRDLKLHLDGLEVPRAKPPQALRYNKGKPILSRILCFPAALAGMAKVTEYGEGKYARYNFLKGAPESEHLDCLLRHVVYKWCRVDLDAESGLDHSNALAWNACRYSDETQRKPAGYVDDRPPAGTFDPEQILALLSGGFEGQVLTPPQPLTAPEPPAKVKSRRRTKR